jgi:peroxiredoxin
MSNPEFYRLRIAGQIINIAIDSTETVTVKGSYPMMATNYVVSDSYENKKIKELALKQIELQAQCQRVVAETEASVDSIQSIIKKLVDQYKDDVTKNYIFKEPMKAYSYFALFQYITVGRQSSLIFNPRENPEDVKVFGAVATSWDTYYPDSERGKNLHNIAIEGMKDQRIVQANNQQLVIDESKVSDAGLFNITLIDNKGQQRSLTDLKGKVVMLDFHLFSVGEESTKRIMQLRDLYNKYHAQGFEIYQISLDSNEHFWKTQTQHLPWVSVYDPDGMNSDNLMKYNVQSLPTFFLIDKNNVLQKRDVQINDIDAEIRSML